MNKYDIKDPLISQEIEKFVSLLISSNIPVKKVILFGSFATGKQHQYSDIDLAVISSPFESDEIEEMMHLAKLSSKASDRIEAVSLREEYLQSKYDTLAGEINKYGQIVYQSN